MTSHAFFTNRTPSPLAPTTGIFPPHVRVGGYLLSVASDIAALEACLALERNSPSHSFSSENGGILSPPAVPYCDFLMLKNNAGDLLAVCRLMRRRLGRDNSVRSSLESGRFQLSPLLTALRYSREGLVEMGTAAFHPDFDSTRSAQLLWEGVIQYLERNGLGFVVGMDSLSCQINHFDILPRLMETYGLHPDLEVEPNRSFNRKTISNTRSFNFDLPTLPPSLVEALRRGCRLAAEPIANELTNRWEFIWVSSRDMLDAKAGIKN